MNGGPCLHCGYAPEFHGIKAGACSDYSPKAPEQTDHCAKAAELLGALSYALDSIRFFAVEHNDQMLAHYIDSAEALKTELVSLNHSFSKKG